MADFTLQPIYPQERTPFPMEEVAAWVRAAVWTLRKVEKSLNDAMKRKTIPFLSQCRICHPRLRKLFILRVFDTKTCFPIEILKRTKRLRKACDWTEE
jgi:hypothetical protein